MKKDNTPKKKEKNRKRPTGEQLAAEFSKPTPTDVLGSYTGNGTDPYSLPQQDADDL